MKVFNLFGWVTFLLVVSAGCGAYADGDYYEEYASFENYDVTADENVTGWFVPTENGSFYWVSREEWDNTRTQYTAEEVEFYLYTNSKPEDPTQIYLNDADGIINSDFNVANPTRFLIHGYLSTRFDDFPVRVRKALSFTGTYNIIVVDWSSMSFRGYSVARRLIPVIGKKVGKFIDFLNMEIGMPFESLALIGHSLGAHVSGLAGKYVKNGKIDVIIGLDPASPLFLYKKKSERLCETDANFVESIQTTTILGFHKPVGKVTFYPNGGRKQPGCGHDPTATCSHFRAYIYYAEAIYWDNFDSIKCDTREEAESKCGETFDNVKLGSPKNYGSEGIYYVPINKKSPYGVGEV